MTFTVRAEGSVLTVTPTLVLALACARPHALAGELVTISTTDRDLAVIDAGLVIHVTTLAVFPEPAWIAQANELMSLYGKAPA